MQRVSQQFVAGDVMFAPRDSYPGDTEGLYSSGSEEEEEDEEEEEEEDEEEEEEEEEEMLSPSPREIVAREAAELLEQQKRLSVRDLTTKFENGQAAAQLAADDLDDSAKTKHTALLNQGILIEKLRKVLESLQGRVAGRNKDDVEEALAAVKILAAQVVELEEGILQEKSEAQKLGVQFKQAAEDAQKMVGEAQAVAHAEIEGARAAIRRIEEALDEQEKAFSTKEMQELEKMRKEVQEARRIKMLHESSKVMDMEHEIDGLRRQLAEKLAEIKKLHRELGTLKSQNGDKSKSYQLEGTECLGSCLQIVSVDDSGLDISHCNIQWYRISSEGDKTELISGAIKALYAPEPFDVGRFLKVEITSPGGQKTSLLTDGCIDPAPGLGNYVEALVRKGGVEFQVVVVQQNGEAPLKQAIHGFHIGKMRIKLHKGRTMKAKEAYSADMQLCGARGGGLAAAHGLFWRAKKGLVFLLAFESARERNASIMLARRFAFDCNMMLAGPDDRAPLGT